MNSDIVNILIWWSTFFAVGVINFPLTALLFKKFPDLGYGISKTFGFIIITYLSFFLAIFHILPFTRVTIIFVLLLLAIVNLYLFNKNKDLLKQIKNKIKIIIFQEIFFSAGYLFWAVVRGYQPDINGLEKFMDYGFVNTLLRSNYLPPIDMWFSGQPINYYWFGHFWTALITKLTAIPSSTTYNLMLATIMGLALSAIFSIVTSLTSHYFQETSKKVYLAGLISAILVIFAGNFHTPVYLLKDGPDKYWYPDATRFIGYHPENNDKTIHEFPMYSFVVSDLHAHLINFPFVLLFIALTWNFLISEDKRLRNWASIAFAGFVLGVMFMTSTWDFGNYLLASGVIYLSANIRKKGLQFNTILDTATQIVVLIFLGILFALPFIINFTSIAQGIALTDTHSALWQLGVLWGYPAVLTIIFTIFLFKSNKFNNPAIIFILALLISSWALIILPEIVYVKDIYIASHHRANTMFKLTYQAFVMSYLTSGFIAVVVMSSLKQIIDKITIFILFFVTMGSVFIYSYYAISSYYGELRHFHGLNGETWLSISYPDQYEALMWLRDNVKGQPVMLEAPGDSYTEFNVLSSYSGIPTVSGWFVHEWLWRGSPDIPQARVSDITLIYTDPDINLTKDMLNKYNVSYVIIGDNEREKFPNIDEAKFNQIGKIVFTSGNLTIYQIQ
jgi:uncharacterized membrane protein